MITIHKRLHKKDQDCRYFFCRNSGASACSACQVKIVSGSLIYHVCMTAIKAVVGVITGSKVLVAEAVHSFSDCAAFGINYFGARKEGFSVPLQSILIGMIMFISGVWICSDNVAIILSRIPARPGLFALIVAKISILANAHLYMISLCTHRRDPGNANIFMFMVQNRTNLFAAFCGFFGILLAVLGFVYFDPIGAILIGCFQIQGAIQIFRELYEKEGRRLELLKRNVTFALLTVTFCIMAFFTFTTIATLDRRNVILIPSEGNTFDSPVSALLGRAPYFCIIDLKQRKTTIQINKSRYYNVEENRIVGATVRNNNAGIVLAGKVGPKMFSSLREGGVRIYYFEGAATVGSVFSEYQSGRLKLAASANSATGFGRTQVRWLGPW